VADNINLFKRSLQPYIDYMQSGDNGFVSTTLDLAAGFEVSVFTGMTAASQPDHPAR
jgi:hypothetical protein